ncbi:PREDICTED: E4 SUMO-protein ligase PIAL2-like isoform X2 [Ipomoea nil]|uniref:E4 SUMO-protein ligase PIAL2-like isoform X2 n=1 Tax=Ipomoea nil TaxID=35883 RepID=UPI000901B9E2|nr:PREDICTED: E4 SUMO-protein ligase PIAL2-like isoform X2 [Ipomoea nil]
MAGKPAVLAGYGGGSRRQDGAADCSRIVTVAHRLATYVCAQPRINAQEFCQLSFLLASDIDFAIANRDVPTKASELPSLVKQVCRHNYEPSLQAANMVLMISVKSACQSGWFSEKDSEDLHYLANEISRYFCTGTDFSSEPSGSQSIIQTIMTRFFPTLKMGQIFVFLEVKPGYGVFVNDFCIPKNVQFSPGENIRLFVAQVDNMETSSCLISPPEVNFLHNGNVLPKRTNMFMDSGPQVPTVLSLKYGTNLLQAVGQFNGNYIILVARMSTISIPDPATQPTLLNFLQPAPALEDPESDVIEGPSRISLNCPISFKHIKTPVKGHSCKHLQCFDYENYVDINSRRPSWRCPYCNQPVCFTDIRIDQDIVKVLKDVGENTTHVIISSDSSWKAIMDSDDHNDEKTPDKSLKSAEGEAVLPCSSGISNAPVDILDLTTLDDEMDEVGRGDSVDQKAIQSNYQGQPCTKNPSNSNHTSHEVDDFWRGIYLSTYVLGTSSSTSNLQTVGVSNHTPISMPSPVLTDAVIPASVMQGGVSSPSTLQHYQFGNSDFPSIVSHTSGTPVAVQAAPALASQHRPRNGMNFTICNGPSATSQDSPAQSLINRNAVPFSLGMQEQFSMSNPNMLQVSQLPPSTLSSTGLEHPFISAHPAQQFTGFQGRGQMPGPYRGSPVFSSQQQGMLNQRAPYVTSNSQGLTRPSASSFLQTPRVQGSSRSGVGQARGGVSCQHAQSMVGVQPSSQTARPVQIPQNAAHLLVNPNSFRVPPGAGGYQHGNMSGTVAVNLPSYQDGRPMVRMRGGLSGQAYNDALRHYNIHPTQQAQAQAQAIPPNFSPQLQVLIANRVAVGSAPVNNSSSTG